MNIGSIDSEIPLALHNSYAAAKAAVQSLGRAINEELKLSGKYLGFYSTRYFQI